MYISTEQVGFVLYVPVYNLDGRATRYIIALAWCYTIILGFIVSGSYET